MAEAILTLYESNCWSFFHTPKTKRRIHWIMQTIGSLMAIVGTAILVPQRKSHFMTIHAITGLISLIFAVIACANGMAALNTLFVLKKFQIRPVVSKIAHNFVGLASFILGEMF